MALIDKTDEIRRLMKAFEKEAAKFYPLTLSLLSALDVEPTFTSLSFR